MKIKALIMEYLRYLSALGRSGLTIRGAKSGLKQFEAWLAGVGISELEELSREVMEEYQEELAFRLTAKGQPLAVRSQSQLLTVVRGFTRFLKDRDYLVRDPGENIKLPRKPRRLPRVIMTEAEIASLIHAPDLTTHRGWRNRIVLEILYDTGIRRAELAGLKAADLDLESGYLHVKVGKGGKERVVPLSERVCELTREYITQVRPSFVRGKDGGWLILNRWGGQMDPNGIWAVVKRCVSLSGLQKNISTHTFRHSCATHMLRNGAPVRHLQEMLGHESLETTQLYTRVTINDLKAIHTKYHPREKMRPDPKK